MKIRDSSDCPLKFGTWIKEGRTNRDLYQWEVAELVGITQSQYCMIENGQRDVDLETAAKICRVLRLDLTEFIKPYL